MKAIVSFIILSSFSWSIGLTGLIIPSNGHVLSMAGTGIAGGVFPSLNPALNISKFPYIQFSLNQWIGDIKGSHIAYRWGQEIPQNISIQTWNANDLELRDDTPDETPLGTFGVYYVAAAYCISHHLNTPFQFGVRVQTNYTHLFTESMSGITLDLGALFPLNPLMTIGVVVRNLGYEYSNNLRVDLPAELGLGTKLKLPFNTSISTDAIYLKEKGTDIRIGVRSHFKFLNVHAGTSVHEKRTAKAFGFSFNYQKWLISYGVYYHGNSSLGSTLPQFFDVRRYL